MYKNNTDTEELKWNMRHAFKLLPKYLLLTLHQTCRKW